MAIMADCVGFQSQIASIMEVLANSAVVEICKIIDDGYTALRSQMEQERGQLEHERDQSEKEKYVLRRKLREMDVKMRSYERRLRRRDLRSEMQAVHFRPPEEVSSIALSLSNEQPRGPLGSIEDHSQFHLMPQEERAALSLIKQERVDSCDVDLKVELNNAESRSTIPETIKDDTERRSVAETHTSPTVIPEDPTETSRTSGSTAILKSENEAEVANQRTQLSTGPDLSADLLNSPGLDLALMQERVLSHLGLSLAQAAASNAEIAGHPSCSYQTQADVESQSRQFPGSEMGVFAPFDMTAPPPAAPLANQRQPHRDAATSEPMGCSFCGRIFRSQACLEVHQRVHTGQRPFSCPHCGKSFAQPNNLRVHLLIHSGERRYRCSICGKSFISSSHLKRHRTVHTQEKPTNSPLDYRKDGPSRILQTPLWIGPSSDHADFTV
ncbi:hypothetical protein DPEC_G00184090 [Dallia pectoralis]|uniref:Uncharacterized protein n=1 Tax=Dallia pectoralis TaxID=75939 RepID=A0ACC2GB93_DALPE|nr:hypothetical protein DPEC_G00184090 [Dallia pectoralis]